MELNEKIKRIWGRPSVVPTEFVEALVAFKMNYWKIDDMRLGLDVYKRQMMCRDIISGEWIQNSDIRILVCSVMSGMGTTIISVSYTHLDVYKRQALYWTDWWKEKAAAQ